jgi:hypothetical protein
MGPGDRGRETQVHIDKRTVANKLREQGEHDRAQQADCALPQRVDTEQDAGLLRQFDVSVRDLIADEAAGRDADAGADGRDAAQDGLTDRG